MRHDIPPSSRMESALGIFFATIALWVSISFGVLISLPDLPKTPSGWAIVGALMVGCLPIAYVCARRALRPFKTTALGKGDKNEQTNAL